MFSLALLVFSLLFSGQLLHAQSSSGEVVGTVIDATGASVPNATVEAVNTATGVKTTTTTNANGEYRILNLLIGRYDVTASAGGFTAFSLKGVQVEASRAATANLTLQVGQVSTTVDVQEAQATIDTTTAQIQTTFETRNAVELPQASNGSLGVINLSLLGAGVTSSGGVGYGTGPSVGGQRPTNNSFNVEGVDNNNRSVTGPVNYIPNEAVGEFTLLQNQFSPEFGHSSGAVFNTVIRSGTNQVHGRLYEYLQNRNLNAIDQANARQGLLSNPRYDYNRLGGQIGGPVIKNKLFYFGNFEYNPIGQASPPAQVIYAPTAAGYSALAGLPGVSKTNLGVLQQYLPAAATATNDVSVQVGGFNVPTGPISVSAPNFQNNYAAVAGGDWTISDRDQFRIRYVYNKQDLVDTAASLPVFFGNVPVRSHLASINEFHNFTPGLVNEFRFAYTRYFQDIPVGSFNFPGLDVFPNIQISSLNVQLGPNPNGPQSTIQNLYQLVDNVSWQLGSHQIKVGYDGRRLISPQVFVQRQRGDYNYTELSTFLLDQSPEELAERTLGAAPYSGDLFSHYAFVNDNWRIRPNFSLNLGIRYEYIQVPAGNRLQALNQIASVPGVIDFREPTAQTNNWAPRVGIAYSPGNSGNTSIRAGFGMAYDQLYQNLGILSLPPQFNTTVDIPPGQAGFLAGGGIRPQYAGGTLSAEDARANTAAYVPDQKRPYSINWNFGIQHVFAQNYTAEIRYLGSRGVFLPVQAQLNRAARVTPDVNIPTYIQAPSASQLAALPYTLGNINARPSNTLAQYGFDQNITTFLPIGNSVYHGLALQLTKRFSQNVSFVAAYTWSHNIDDSTASVFSTYLTPRRPQDFFNLRAERSSSALDRRHRFTYTVNYDILPFRDRGYLMKNIVGNWNLSGTYTFESPEYATVQSGVDANLNGDSAGDRAIVNPNGDANIGSGVYAVDRTGAQVPFNNPGIVAYVALNPNARYIQAREGAYANAGRNTIPLRRINNVDLALYKRLNLTERTRFEFGAQAYNLANHPQYTPGSINTVNLVSRTTSRNFLIPGNPAFNQSQDFFSSNPRSLQLVARFIW